jgi:hypothetical protein
MSSTDHDDGCPWEREAAPALAANLSTAADGRLRCTLRPADVTADEVGGRWITAYQDAFVDTSTIR